MNREFRDTGARKQFIDEVNAARKELDGALSKLPFQNPALPQDFADAFFLSEPPREEAEESLEDVKAAVAELSTQLAERQEQLKQMEQDAAVEAQLEAERKARDEQAAELEAKAKAMLAEAAKLRGK